jgi:hypothetical protein
METVDYRKIAATNSRACRAARQRTAAWDEILPEREPSETVVDGHRVAGADGGCGLLNRAPWGRYVARTDIVASLVNHVCGREGRHGNE